MPKGKRSNTPDPGRILPPAAELDESSDFDCPSSIEVNCKLVGSPKGRMAAFAEGPTVVVVDEAGEIAAEGRLTDYQHRCLDALSYVPSIQRVETASVRVRFDR